jgi:hypothetical protein
MLKNQSHNKRAIFLLAGLFGLLFGLITLVKADTDANTATVSITVIGEGVGDSPESNDSNSGGSGNFGGSGGSNQSAPVIYDVLIQTNRLQNAIGYPNLLWKTKPSKTSGFLYYGPKNNPTKFGPYKVMPNQVGEYGFSLAQIENSDRYIYKIVAVGENNVATVSEGVFDWFIPSDSPEGSQIVLPVTNSTTTVIKPSLNKTKPQVIKTYRQAVIAHPGCGVSSLLFMSEK